jgi:Stage II sporulation protein E (SpoIIE)/Phosphoserine phosphatase RsbU, N-terminal domain
MTPEPALGAGLSAATLRERYQATFRAFLRERDEESLGSAYALGREAVTAQLSVLDLAEAHHFAVQAAMRDAATPQEQGEALEAGAEFLREALSTFDIATRGYHEVQEVARLEHEYVQQLRALADASLAISATLTEEEILQLTADAARGIMRARSAHATSSTIGLMSRTLSAASPSTGTENGVLAGAARAEVKLAGGGRVLGDLVVTDVPGREFTPRDEAILAQLGQLASVAIVNAQLYGRERHIAHVLQRSLLPLALPTIAGLGASVRFWPAGEGIEVGGDFYDLFAARDGAYAVLIGDVQGKGPEAAAVTALARHTLRAAAAYEPRPSQVLGLLHRALRQERSDGRFCTVAYGHLHVRRDGASLTLACGGHPLPFVVRRDGPVEPIGRLGTLLGSDVEPQLTDVTVELAAGDVVVLYTDGVTEVRRRRQEVFGHRQLIEVLRACVGLDPDAIAERVEQAVLAAAAGKPRDDIAILALGPRQLDSIAPNMPRDAPRGPDEA